MKKSLPLKIANRKYIWIQTHLCDSDAFYAYLLNSSGLNIYSCNYAYWFISRSWRRYTVPEGYMKISPDGKTLAIASRSFTEMLDFNNVNGTISNARKLLYNSNPIDALGMEFSPDGSKLYLNLLDFLFTS